MTTHENEFELQSAIHRVGELVGGLGLSFSEMPRHALGGGFALAFAEDVIVAVSVSFGNHHQFSISWGVAKDLARDAASITWACNRHNQDLTAYPVHLHDADAGWDILQTCTFPVQLFEAEPDFIAGWLLNPGYSAVIRGIRDAFVAAGIAMQPYLWNADDANRLMMRSLI